MRSKTQRQRIYMHICEAHNTHVICKVHMLILCHAFCHPPPPCFAVVHPPVVCIYPPVVCIIHPPVRINIISRRHNMAMHARCLQWQLNEILKIRILYSICTLPKSFVYSLMSLLCITFLNNYSTGGSKKVRSFEANCDVGSPNLGHST